MYQNRAFNVLKGTNWEECAHKLVHCELNGVGHEISTIYKKTR